MTIAACYLSSEGLVLGADSTSTISGPDPQDPSSVALHHFNFEQKIFEVGTSSQIGILMWGLGSLRDLSYRTMIALFADDLKASQPSNMQEVATRWAQRFWSAYSREMKPHLDLVRQLRSAPTRTPDEDRTLLRLENNLSGGFCVGGVCCAERTPEAFEVTYAPSMTTAEIKPITRGQPSFWGVPNLAERLLYGIDLRLFGSIVSSQKWTGTPDDLAQLVRNVSFGQPPLLPIRDAIDWVDSSIYATIKGMKFSLSPPVCGGPVELAVITSDRPFRWVRHKKFDVAIGDGML